MFKITSAERVYEVAIEKPTENYFILQSLLKTNSPYEGMYVDETESVFVLMRKTGTCQVFQTKRLDDFQWMGLRTFLERLPFTQIIGVYAIYEGLKRVGFSFDLKEGAWIAYLEQLNVTSQEESVITPLTSLNLSGVEQLYQQVFEGYANKAYMAEKLKTGRGRGYCIVEGEQLISVAQSDFECMWGAVIVGVATDPQYANKGYATKLVGQLCKVLVTQCQCIGLIYENKAAGRIYERLGFVPKDRLYHMKRRGQ